MDEGLQYTLLGAGLMLAGIMVGIALDWLTSSHDPVAGWLPAMLGLALLLPTRDTRA